MPLPMGGPMPGPMPAPMPALMTPPVPPMPPGGGGMPPMGAPPAPAGPDPADELLLEEMIAKLQAELQEEVKPKYKYGFDPKKIKKPTIPVIENNAREIRVAHTERLDGIAETYNWLRQHYAGAWERDREAREKGAQEAWYLSKLIDEEEAMVSVVSGIDIAWNKPCTHPEYGQDTQKLEDFTYHLRHKEERGWQQRGRMSLKVAEAKDLIRTGMVVSRRVPDTNDPDCPYNWELIDPATVFWVEGGKRGIRAAAAQ